MSDAPRILPFRDAEAANAGGKAAGLGFIEALGLDVPPGFVIVGARPGEHPTDLAWHYDSLGSGAVAVRSSAIGEDGAEASFAGQFDTILDVVGLEALQVAIDRCLASLASGRARAYESAQAPAGAGAMAVVVQRMIPPRVAGVLFTADPVSGRRDRVVVDAVAGLGEALVSGEATPDHYLLDRDGAVRGRSTVGDAPLLDDACLKRLLREAERVEQARDMPLDLEWAIDDGGRIWWLQARPITVLPDLCELDSPPLRPDDVYTRCNIGEMMPGAVSPLTIATTARGIEYGMQLMLHQVGARARVDDRFATVSVSHGHLFINLTELGEMCRAVAGADADHMCLSICGRPVPELRLAATAPLLQRVANGWRYGRYVLGARRAVHAHRPRLAAFCVETTGSSVERHAAIGRALPFLDETYGMHLRSSSVSGVTSGILQGILAEGAPPTTEHHAEVARLLVADAAVESADLVRDLEGVARRIGAHPDVGERLVEASAPEALAWLRAEESGDAGASFRAFLATHGHRSYRELSMRSLGWADDPEALLASLRAAIRSALSRGQAQGLDRPGREVATAGNRAIRWILPKARRAVHQREASKSMLVEVTHRIKRAYRALAAVLVEEDKLPDADLLFFLSHEELGTLAATGDAALVTRAAERRRAFQLQKQLQFPEVFVGRAEPLDPVDPDADADDGDALTGQPVSVGVVEGRVRVARDLEDAALLEEGEILVAPVTDVGWSPYFALIGGLVTEVGSAVSHGAVVAREYGLPALVNVPNATRRLRTGERVRLDAGSGRIERLND